MQDAQLNPEDAKAGERSGNPLMTVGIVVALGIVGLISFQFWRAGDTNAAEQRSPGQTAANLSAFEQPVGRVNGQSITMAELATECIDRDGAVVLENLINRTLIRQACAEQGIAVTDAEVRSEILEISKKFGLPLEQWYQMLQTERGLTPMQYQRDVIWPMLALKKLAGTEVQITREMMQEAYVDNYGPRVKARVIYLDNLRRAEQIAQKLKADPEQFEELAREYSVEPTSKALGGVVPPIRRYSGAHEEVRRVAFNMAEAGQVSGVIQTEVGQYVIIRYEGRTEPVEHDLKDVQAQLHEQLVEREVQTRVAETFQAIREKARIDNYLTGQSLGVGNTAGGTDTSSDAVQQTAAELPLNLSEPE